jgi:hypothetical protein
VMSDKEGLRWYKPVPPLRCLGISCLGRTQGEFCSPSEFRAFYGIAAEEEVRVKGRSTSNSILFGVKHDD